MGESNSRADSVCIEESTDAFNTEVPEAEIRTALNEILRGSLKSLSLGLGLLYLILVPSHILVLPGNVAAIMAPLAFGTALVLFGLAFFLRRQTLPADWAHPVGTGIAGLALLNSLAHLYLTAYPAQTTNLMLLVIGAGVFFLSNFWLCVVIGATLTGWGIVVWSVDLSLYPVHRWVHFGFGLAMAVLLSILAHHARIQNYRRFEGLRIRDALLKEKLLEALRTVDKARRTEEGARHDLEEALKALKTSERQFRMLVETMNEGLCVQDENAVKVYVNDKTCEMFGYSRDELIGRHAFDFFDSTNRRLLEKEIEKRKRGERGTYEIQVRAKDGRSVPVLMSSAPIFDEQGRFKGSIEAITDITAFRQAEEDRKLYTARLEQSNRELQEFAFVASHDLQEPLRKIQAFGERLKTRSGDALDDMGRDYVERMQSAAKRMQDLILALLSYSRITTQAEPFVPVDLNQVVREVLDDLESRIEQSEGRVEVETLPIVEADPSQMRRLFQNLIGNGLKFHKKDEHPVVRIYAREANGQQGKAERDGKERYHIFVEDNGIGFDEKYLDRVFALFQRLHGRSEYEGTGMGLAICRKIVDRHGGNITARSEPGKGATFIVTLPVKHSQCE